MSLRAAFAVGIPLREYNEMTPYELTLAIQEHSKRERYMQEERVIQAYITAGWQRVKRMPKLEKVLGREPAKKKPMTDKQMLDMVRMLNKKMGGKEV